MGDILSNPDSIPFREISPDEQVVQWAVRALRAGGIIDAHEVYVASLHPDAEGVRGGIWNDLRGRGDEAAAKFESVDRTTVQGWINEDVELVWRTIFTAARN